MSSPPPGSEQPASAAPGPSWTDAIERLLDLAREELVADVEILPTDAHLGARPLDALDLPLVRADGVVRGALRIIPRRGGLTVGNEDRMLRLLARMIAEQLDAAEVIRSSRGERLDTIKAILVGESLRMVYQPVVNLRTGEVVGAEALARFPHRPHMSPDRWFRQATSVGLGTPLEILAVERALSDMDRLPPTAYLSLNVSPEVAVSQELRAVLRDVTLDRIVLEITEHAEVGDYEMVNEALKPLRHEGLRLAVDDAGAGFASLRHILQMSPDIIKLDISLTRDIDHNSVLRALSYSLTAFASAIDASVIAEGIENERELQALRFLGVGYGQGFFLRSPGPLPVVDHIPESVLNQSTSA